jgi:antitoxin (DNA-binding transcriptional repressor) of toxin-antitoxin stability system
MKTYELEGAPHVLRTLVSDAQAGEEIVLTSHEQPVAKIVRIGSAGKIALPANGPAVAAAMRRLAQLGGIPGIPDPMAWQREIREERLLPGRS